MKLIPLTKPTDECFLMLQRRAVGCCSLRTQTRGSAEGQAGRRAGCSAPSAETKVGFEKLARLLKETVAYVVFVYYNLYTEEEQAVQLLQQKLK
jgi:hypothetical protein